MSPNQTNLFQVNERMAQRLWPNAGPDRQTSARRKGYCSGCVGCHQSQASVIVGVVRNTRAGSLSGEYNDQVYLPITPAHEQPEMYILLRSHTTPAATASALRRAVARIDSHVAVTRVRSLDEVIATSVSAPHALGVLLLGFGSLALLIGATGVYSLISDVVSWRIPRSVCASRLMRSAGR